MGRSKTPSYVLTLELDATKHQEDILSKRLEIARQIYNSLTDKALKRYNLLIESKEYRQLKKELLPINKQYHATSNVELKKSLEKQRQALYKKLNDLYKKYGLSKNSLEKDVQPMYVHFIDNIGSTEAQVIAARVWSKFDKLLNGEAEKVYFSKQGNYNSIENKYNRSGLRYIPSSGCIIWGDKLTIPVIIKNNDVYAQKAIQDRVKYCRLVKKYVNGKYKFYAQLILEGIPPIKVNKDGEIKRTIGLGDCGLDIGTRTIAISSKTDVKLLELCPKVNYLERLIANLKRKLDRQRRANNPNNYNINGTIKKSIKLNWIKSKKYTKTQNELNDIQRKQAAIRKQSHEILSNEIISSGDRFLVETMQYQALQKRSKKTTKNKKGRFNKKKRFGKSLANKAPAMLIEIIERKLNYDGLSILKINTQKVKASQYNHFTNEYNKKDLKDRWNNDINIQRDLYSSFLIMNVSNDLETIDKDKCSKTYDNFKTLHDKEINRLRELKNNGVKLISSMGI